jgi:23S rRNA (guanosine2251-2'-O)-methyltransferase
MLNASMAKRKRPSRPPSSQPAPSRQKHPRGRPREAGGGGSWLFGAHTVLAALANPTRRCRRLLLTEEAERVLGPRLREAAAEGAGAPVPERATRRQLDALLGEGAVHQGVALEAEPLPAATVEEVLAALADVGDAVLLVLDQPNDPHNVGAILRSAAAFGAAAVVVPDRGTPDVTPVLAKAASGALEKVPLVRVTNLVRTLEKLKEAGFWCAGLDGSATETVADADLPPRVALVAGAEGSGLRRLTRETCDYLLRIPIGAEVESLNLSNAVAVALYELARRAKARATAAPG